MTSGPTSRSISAVALLLRSGELLPHLSGSARPGRSSPPGRLGHSLPPSSALPAAQRVYLPSSRSGVFACRSTDLQAGGNLPGALSCFGGLPARAAVEHVV